MNFFKSKNPPYEHLRKKWMAKHKALTQNLMDKHLRQVALTSLGGLLLLPTSGLALSSHQVVDEFHIQSERDTNKLLSAVLADKVPLDVRSLTPEEEQSISATLSKETGLKVLPEIDGKRLNRTYGLIGGEQHLYRYPGDSVEAQMATTRDWAMYGEAGLAPGLGAWGYFAPSREALTKKDIDREKYYLAVQTFLSPGFAERVAEYRDFYKYRKMLVVNPQTGQSVVADIADAGPSEYTGKHLGGSPEVMEVLGLASGPRKGAVLYFFIDDPSDQVPLGPLKIPEKPITSEKVVIK